MALQFFSWNFNPAIYLVIKKRNLFIQIPFILQQYLDLKPFNNSLAFQFINDKFCIAFTDVLHFI